jgi:anti-sigma28 factor (negative regulator of flagellin synthesis)
MRINDSQLPRKSGLGASNSVSLTTANPESRSGHSATEDSVTLSQLTTLLASVAGDAAASRTAYVDRIAGEFRGGTYMVDNAALGNALIERWLEW